MMLNKIPWCALGFLGSLMSVCNPFFGFWIGVSYQSKVSFLFSWNLLFSIVVCINWQLNCRIFSFIHFLIALHNLVYSSNMASCWFALFLFSSFAHLLLRFCNLFLSRLHSSIPPISLAVASSILMIYLLILDRWISCNCSIRLKPLDSLSCNSFYRIWCFWWLTDLFVLNISFRRSLHSLIFKVVRRSR